MSTTRRVGTVDGRANRRQHGCRDEAWPSSAFPAPATRAPRREGLLAWTLAPGDIAGAPAVRRLVMTTLRRRASAAADLEAAEVVVAELLNNALAHTPGPAWIGLSWDGPHPLLTVTDVGPGFAHRPELLDEHQRLVPQLPSDELSEQGRGLYLVAQLTHDLVVTQRPTGGSVVSVTLKLHRR